MIIIDCLRDEVREAWVAAVNPSSGSNSVGLVLDLAREHLIEVLEDCLL